MSRDARFHDWMQGWRSGQTSEVCPSGKETAGLWRCDERNVMTLIHPPHREGRHEWYSKTALSGVGCEVVLRLLSWLVQENAWGLVSGRLAVIYFPSRCERESARVSGEHQAGATLQGCVLAALAELCSSIF